MQNIGATCSHGDTPLTHDRTAIVLAARRMIHAAKVKRQWGDYACWPTAAYACTEYLADGASEKVKGGGVQAARGSADGHHRPSEVH